MAQEHEKCAIGVENRQRIISLEKDLINLDRETKEKDDKLWIAVASIRDRLMNRLPTWATIMFTILGSVCSALAVKLLSP